MPVKPCPLPYGLACNAAGSVATCSAKFASRFLIKYCSIFLPSLSLTTTFSMFAGSVQYNSYVSGSLIKNWSPYLQTLLNILNARLCILFSLTQLCKVLSMILASVSLGGVKKSIVKGNPL